jgi:PhoD-like phosphatase
MATSTWVVPGAPLDEGRGWRIWYSRSGRDDFEPEPVAVSRAGRSEALADGDKAWRLLDPVDGLGRRMGILTVELAEPAAGAEYEIRIPELAPAPPLRWRTLPTSYDDGEVTFLMSSCYWLPNDKEGAYGAAIRELVSRVRPAFKLLIGDQVYQDYPFDWFQPRSTFSLYASRYEQYWGNAAYQEVLQATPNYFVCDDHEFWNDFPEPQIQIGRTWTDGRRAECARAAKTLYGVYQREANPGGRAFYSFRIGDVSFFVTDARSERTRFDLGGQTPHFFNDAQWQELEAWVDGLEGPGVLVLGQPLFQRDGDWKDHSLSNFREDYGRLTALLERSLARDEPEKRHDILILTGDIHNARYTVATVDGVPAPPYVHELVASPASRVGPYLTEPNPQQPPTKFAAEYGGRRSTWRVVMPPSDVVPSVDNNAAAITLTPGPNGTVRFAMTIWRVRPLDSRGRWARVTRRSQPQGDVIPLYQKEIELR